MNTEGLDDLDLKKPSFPDEYLFPIENISGSLEEYSNLKNCLKKTSESAILSQTELKSLHQELTLMKATLLSKQEIYQEQFQKLKDWMTEAFEVESPQVLLDHQTKVKEAELIAEEAASQGNSKQHQRIRALNNNNQSIKTENSNSTAVPTSGRASKNLSRMNNVASSAASSGTSASGIGQGQKDLSAIKSKVPNQIPINVFWNYIEPFFKPIDEDDLKFLDDPSHVMDVAPFVIPPLGLHYEKIWYEQYGYVVPGGDSHKRDSSRLINDPQSHIQLRDRLLSALIDSEARISEDLEDEEYGDDSFNTGELDNFESVPLDDRLRASLNELGFTDLTTSRDYQENDEICVEMRSVQRQLREQIVVNQYRKKRLAEFIRTKLASQEFYSLIGDLDKQIDGVFQKRIKSVKKKKSASSSNKLTSTAPSATDSTSSLSTVTSEIPQEAIQCLSNRRKLLDNFAVIIPGRVESLCPQVLIDFDPKIEDEIVESARKTSKWLPLPDIHLIQPLTLSQPAFPNSRES